MWALPAPWMKLIYGASLALAAGWLTARLSRPISRTQGPVRVVLAVFATMLGLGAVALLTAAPGSLIDEMITLAGGENVVGKLPQRYPSVSEEVVLRADPDVILMPSGEDQQQRKARLLERPGWESLQAVKSGRIYFVQEDLVSRPGPRLVDGLVEMARALYPARFADLPPAATSDDSPASLD